MFTDSYGEQSCTAGRASFITRPKRLPDGSHKSWHPGCAGRVCKLKTRRSRNCLSHLATQRDSSARTIWATEINFCRRPTGLTNSSATSTTLTLKKIRRSRLSERQLSKVQGRQFGPRGVLHCFATDKDDATDEPRWGRVGKQKIKDTGPLTRKRMETCDDDLPRRQWTSSLGNIRLEHHSSAGLTSPICTCRTHTKPASLGQAGEGNHPITTR